MMDNMNLREDKGLADKVDGILLVPPTPILALISETQTLLNIGQNTADLVAAELPDKYLNV